MRHIGDTSGSVLDDLDSEFDFDEPKVAHIVNREDKMMGYVMGNAIVALCGTVFVPTRDPDKYPLCEVCKEVLNNMIERLK